jgi:hypothetical protein
MKKGLMILAILSMLMFGNAAVSLAAADGDDDDDSAVAVNRFAPTVTVAAPNSLKLNISGLILATYDTEAKDDRFEARLNFGYKISDKVSAHLKFKSKDINDVNKKKATLWTNEAYTSIITDYGKLKVGMFEYKTYNTIVLENGWAILGKVKSPFAVGYISNPLWRVFTFSGIYSADESGRGEYDANEPIYNDASVITLKYKKGPINADINYAMNMKSGSDLAHDDAWIVNAAYRVNKYANLRLHWGQNEKEKRAAVWGSDLSFGKAYATFEYDSKEEIASDFNRWGYRVGYYFKNDAMRLEFRNKHVSRSAAIVPEVRFYTFF